MVSMMYWFYKLKNRGIECGSILEIFGCLKVTETEETGYVIGVNWIALDVYVYFRKGGIAPVLLVTVQ